MLITLQQQYSCIQRLKEVYATTSIKEHIAVVYRLGIEFVHEAALYYSKGTFQRFLYHLSQPPSIALEVKVSDIKKAMEEMRMEMEILDRIRLNNIEKKLGDLGNKVDKVEESLEGNQHHHCTFSEQVTKFALKSFTSELRMNALKACNSCSRSRCKIRRRSYAIMIDALQILSVLSADFHHLTQENSCSRAQNSNIGKAIAGLL